MISAVVEKELEYSCYVLDIGDRKTELALLIYGGEPPKVGDKILIHEDLLNENWKYYTQPYCFEYTVNIAPVEIKERNDREYALIKKDGKIFALKRIYG